MKNIVLIGMPGCGKSTFGKRMAKRLQLPFYDADTVLEEREQRTIKAFFAEARMRSAQRKRARWRIWRNVTELLSLPAEVP